MMQSLSLEEDNMIKDKRNLSRLKKQLNYTAIKDTTNLLRLGKETTEIKDTLIIFLSMKKKKIITN